MTPSEPEGMPAKKPRRASRLVAVIDLGSSAVRMVIAEIRPDGEIHVLENLNKPVALGKEVFVTRRINRTAALQTIDVLKGFRELMAEYNVSVIRAVGTSALREAADRETFLDRIFLRTGIDVEVIEGIEENRIVFYAVQDILGDRLNEDTALVVEVGAGNTDVTLLDKGEVAMAHTIRTGTLRLLRERGRLGMDPGDAALALRQRVENAVESLAREFPIGHTRDYVALGSEARFVAARVGEREGENCAIIPPKAFRDFLRKVARKTPDEIGQEFGLPYADAETVVPALIIHERFLELTTPERIFAPSASLRDGLLLEMASLVSPGGRGDFSGQIVASAKAMGRKYRYDEAHSLHVTELALKLFSFLQDEHHLSPRGRLLLEVAGILHDIGGFISTTGHHKHGAYLVRNSEIFGLRRDDLAIVANCVRYHRRALPDTRRHPEYAALSREDRVKVAKIAAMVRLADALDRSHRQHVRNVAFERQDDQFIINVAGRVDLSLERAGLPSKADLFGEVFGYDVVLRNTLTGLEEHP